MNLVVFTKYGDRAASARQRYMQFGGHLKAAGIGLSVMPLLANDYLDATFSGQRASKFGLVLSYVRRFMRLAGEKSADAIWLQYELFPYAPSLFETLALPRGIPLIVDYDDAIFHQYDLHGNPLIRAVLGGKLKPLLRRADLAICGNAYLQDYAERYCKRTEIVPTVVDTETYGIKPSPRPSGPVVVGWIGSPSTWNFVKPLVPLLVDAAERHDLAVRVVGAGPQSDTPPRFEFLSWSEPQEIASIQSMDIGIMPLPDEPWARGKCGYKLIQYMACGLPVIASAVGVNSDIVDHGVNGFLANTPQEWAEAIGTLANDADLRRTMGAAGRRKIENEYSLAIHGPRLVGMIHEVLERTREERTRGLGH